MRGRRTTGALLAVTVSTTLVGACGTRTPPAPDPAPAPRWGAQPHQMLAATASDRVGQFVADAAGFALYRSDRDSADPPQSTCDGVCARTWPPVLVSEHTMTAGVDPTLVGSVARPDGRRQVTLAGRPLYRHAGDRRAGDLSGQGLDGVWFAVTPEGRKAPAESATPSAKDGGGS
ncbi:hypothetical protein GCM10022243_22720 [Saccharothrix violaceirubra]|uniref:Putative lipoprotein with Yx(FWY)xxD motif n=1 Tax=Saccharothrix violaceirubra TaxID=413306 RepID=A0A7W7T1E6_9PSEU|nr:hypothetical protein [Saccharothrix violaceirubra]MBB4964792.1 putative lipoprotein with Yx(FWY)xxD motif [Saccharothrix violaceirubra]